MIGIDTVPTEECDQPAVVYSPATADEQPVDLPVEGDLRDLPQDAPSGEAELEQDLAAAAPAEGSSVPAQEKAAGREAPVAESADELLQRLEDEKQEWQRQLAAMKQTLAEQDKKIEEDRSKRKKHLEERKVEKEQRAIVAKNQAARTRYVVQQAAANGQVTIPAITGRTRMVWPGLSGFHTRRARTAAKSAPFYYANGGYQSLAAGSGQGRLQLGPPRYGKQGAITRYTGGQQQRPSFGYGSSVEYDANALMLAAGVTGRVGAVQQQQPFMYSASSVPSAAGSIVPPTGGGSVTLSMGGSPGLIGTQQSIGPVTYSSALPASFNTGSSCTVQAAPL